MTTSSRWPSAEPGILELVLAIGQGLEAAPVTQQRHDPGPERDRLERTGNDRVGARLEKDRRTEPGVVGLAAAIASSLGSNDQHRNRNGPTVQALEDLGGHWLSRRRT